jgi:hypothetical protein
LLQRAQGELLARFALHLWQQIGVVDGAMRAVGGEDWGTHVSAHLCSAEDAWSALARTLLQRGRRAIPPLMPPQQHPPSALHRVAARERSEATSGVARSVLEEDVVLGFSAEVRHCYEENGLRVGESVAQSCALSARESGLDATHAPHYSKKTDPVKPTT